MREGLAARLADVRLLTKAILRISSSVRLNLKDLQEDTTSALQPGGIILI
jgi:hypothetical protein